LGNWPSIRREESTTEPIWKTTWLARIPIVRSPVSPPAIRSSSCSARAGTLASKPPSIGASSAVSFTLRR
jgi:hypothetical protein